MCGRATVALVDHAVLVAQQLDIISLNHGIAQLFCLAYGRARVALYTLPENVEIAQIHLVSVAHASLLHRPVKGPYVVQRGCMDDTHMIVTL